MTTTTVTLTLTTEEAQQLDNALSRWALECSRVGTEHWESGLRQSAIDWDARGNAVAAALSRLRAARGLAGRAA